MTRSFSLIALLVVALSALAMLAWGQGTAAKPNQATPRTPIVKLDETPAYMSKEIKKLKRQLEELQTRLAAAEAKNKAQDESLSKKEDKMVPGPDYAGGGWCSKNVFLTAMDKDKTMIRFITVK